MAVGRAICKRDGQSKASVWMANGFRFMQRRHDLGFGNDGCS